MIKKIVFVCVLIVTMPVFSCASGMISSVQTNSQGDEKYDDIKWVVTKLHDQMDQYFQEKIQKLSSDELLQGQGFYTSADVVEYQNAKAQKMSLEYTLRFYNESFDSFITKISPNNWGLYLDKLIGRGISDVVTNDEGLITQQVERMVLKSFPLNMDMTKTEVIEYEEGRTTVYWRVFRSENETTLSDVGSVSFIKMNDQTLVVFRSAHRLGLGGFEFPNNWIIQKQIKDTFLNHLESYNKKLITRAN